jgi:inhibitor of KinA sporulation pathway (predicted exonuclease)
LNFIIYDLEATCWRGRPPGMIQEIIEIGAFLINPYGEVEGEYNRFIRPYHNPYLSAFCQELTTITQEEVDRASLFPDVIEEFQDWAGVGEEDYLLCSWGKFDQKMLINDCKLHNLDYDWVDPHINLKKQYQQIKKLRKPIGLRSAVEREGFDFSGTHHRGIDDAHNLAKVFAKYLDEWQF